MRKNNQVETPHQIPTLGDNPLFRTASDATDLLLEETKKHLLHTLPADVARTAGIALTVPKAMIDTAENYDGARAAGDPHPLQTAVVRTGLEYVIPVSDAARVGMAAAKKVGQDLQHAAKATHKEANTLSTSPSLFDQMLSRELHGTAIDADIAGRVLSAPQDMFDATLDTVTARLNNVIDDTRSLLTPLPSSRIESKLPPTEKKSRTEGATSAPLLELPYPPATPHTANSNALFAARTTVGSENNHQQSSAQHHTGSATLPTCFANLPTVPQFSDHLFVTASFNTQQRRGLTPAELSLQTHAWETSYRKDKKYAVEYEALDKVTQRYNALTSHLNPAGLSAEQQTLIGEIQNKHGELSAYITNKICAPHARRMFSMFGHAMKKEKNTRDRGIELCATILDKLERSIAPQQMHPPGA